MPRTGDTYSRLPISTSVVGQPIKASIHEAEMNDVANEISKSARLTLLKDATGVGLVTQGGPGAYTLGTNTVYGALKDGLVLTFTPHLDNGAGCTLNIDTLGAVVMRKLIPTGESNLFGGDLKQGGKYTAIYSATANGGAGAWIVLNPVPSAGVDERDALTFAYYL